MRNATNQSIVLEGSSRLRRGLVMVLLSGMAGLAVTPCPGQDAVPENESTVAAALVRNQAQMAALRKEYEGVKMKLYEVRRKHERSEIVSALRAAAQRVAAAYEAAKDSNPAMLAARKTQREISESLKVLVQKRIETSPDGVALRRKVRYLTEQAAALRYARAVAELKLTYRDSPIVRALDKDAEVVRLRSAYYKAKSGKARDEARAAYYAARKAALAKMPEARALRAEMAAASKGEREAETARRDAERELRDVERRIEADKNAPDVVALQAKLDAARQAERDAYNGPEIKAARDARSAAYSAASTKVNELLAEDAVAVELEARYRQLRKDMSALEREARALRKKAKTSSKKK